MCLVVRYIVSIKEIYTNGLLSLRCVYSNSFGKTLLFFFYNSFMEFLNELLQNQQNTVIGLGLAIIVLLGIYMKLLDIYK